MVRLDVAQAKGHGKKSFSYNRKTKASGVLIIPSCIFISPTIIREKDNNSIVSVVLYKTRSHWVGSLCRFGLGPFFQQRCSRLPTCAACAACVRPLKANVRQN